MGTRVPPDEITKGLQTTSDKIRALAKANYDRTEISKLLDIRYQHVRNVLQYDISITSCMTTRSASDTVTRHAFRLEKLHGH